MENKFKEILEMHLVDAILDSLWLFKTTYFEEEHFLEIVCANLHCYVYREQYNELNKEFYSIYGASSDSKHTILKLATAMNNTLSLIKE